MEMKGKKAIVFGGTSGIGLATVIALHEAGAKVIVVGMSANKDIPELPNVIIRKTCDVRDTTSVEALFQECGQLDIIVSTATGGQRVLGSFAQMNMQGYRASFDKLWGYANVVRYGLNCLTEHGRIVIVSGSPARKCNSGQVALSSVGAAVEAFAKGIAKEIKPKRINVICPGVIDTPIVKIDKHKREEYFSSRTENNLISRVGTPEECSQGIMFLLENDFVTGTVLDVDGGAILSCEP